MHRADGLVADGLALRAREAGDAKIHHFNGTVRQQHDVLRFDVAVDDALGMGMLQRPQHLGGKIHRLFPGQGAAALLEILFKRDAVDVFHDDILQPVGDRNIIHLDDVRVAEDRDRLGFIFETADEFLVIQKFFFEHLDRNGVAGLFVHAAVDVGHTAHADQALDQIPAVQSSSNQVIHC